MYQPISHSAIKQTALFALAFFAITLLFIFLNANTKWTGYDQACVNVLSMLASGDLRGWISFSVMAGLIVYVFRNK